MSQMPEAHFRDCHECMPEPGEIACSTCGRLSPDRIIDATGSHRREHSPQPASRWNEPPKNSPTALLPEKNLAAILPKTGYLFVATSLVAAVMLSLVMVKLAKPSNTTLVTLLSIVSFLACSTLIMGIAFGPTIRQPPQSPGLPVLVMFFVYTVVQFAEFLALNKKGRLWRNGWPASVKTLGLVWTLLSWTSIAIYVFALIWIMVISRKQSKKLDLEAAKVPAADETSRSKSTFDDDEKAFWEHIEHCRPQPAYKHVCFPQHEANTKDWLQLRNICMLKAKRQVGAY